MEGPMVRVAIIGLGAVTRNIHLPAYAQMKNRVTIVGGCDVDPTAQDLARGKWKLPHVCGDARELIDKTKPDIVSVCTPPAFHLDHSMLALRTGCHVFCEKPLADNLEQADEIIETSKKTGKLVVVNTQFPYMKIHTAAKRLAGSQEFGRLLYMHAWQTFLPTEATEAGWRGKLRRSVCVEFADGRAASMMLNRLSKGPERYLDMRLDGEVASIYTSIGGRIDVKAGVHTRDRQ